MVSRRPETAQDGPKTASGGPQEYPIPNSFKRISRLQISFKQPGNQSVFSEFRVSLPRGR
eukprot:4597334-Pyramimonas_sp.AAC.1